MGYGRWPYLLEDLLVDALGESPLDVLDGALVAVLLQMVERVLRHVGHAQVVVLPYLITGTQSER